MTHRLARPCSCRFAKRSTASATCSTLRALPSSRDTSYRLRTRCSRSPASRAWARSPAVSCPTTKPTTSITAKVKKKRSSATASENRGGTKNTLSNTTASAAASSAGPRPNRAAETTTASRNTSTTLAVSSVPASGVTSSAVATHTPAAPA
jgi:hypothetical protein